MRHSIKTATCLPLLLILLGMLWVTPAGAQFGIPAGAQPELRSDPEFPAPGQEFTVSIANPPRGLSRGNIAWFINGTEQLARADKQKITLTAPSLGERMQIETLIVSENDPTVRIEKTVISNDVDIIIEGDTIAPQFYRGRHLPSAGSNMRAVAIPHVYGTDGMRVPVGDLAFRWSIDNRVVLEGRGADMLETTFPRTGDVFLRVAVENMNGTIVHEASASVAPVEPFVRFYRVNALLGLREHAIGRTLNLTGDEVTVRAEPYFVSRDIFANADYAWQLNQNEIDNPSSDPQLITLRRTGSGGTADVAFSIRNLNALLQHAAGLFSVNFAQQ